jgi:hypothetical protein
MDDVLRPPDILANKEPSQMKEIAAFQTSDGTVFETKEAAEDHEFNVSHEIQIESFLSSDLNRYQGGPQRVIAKTSILNWIKWNK